MANELYRTYEVLIEESIHPSHPKRAKDKTSKPPLFNEVIDGALRDTHMIFQDAVCYNTLCLAGLAGSTELPLAPGETAQLLNPLWKHLTTPAKDGGINEETERVIRRLAAHYPPLKDVKTTQEFLNGVYSEPLRTKAGMSEEQKAQVLKRRAACYEMLEAAARNKKTGELNCEGMAPFAKTWTGLLCVGKKASIPSELPYARFTVELRDKIAAADTDDDLKRVFDATIESYRSSAQAETNQELELRFGQEVAALKQEIAKLEALPPESKARSAKLGVAHKRLEKFQTEKQQWFQTQWAEIRAKLPADVKETVTPRFMKQTTATSLKMTEAEFAEAKEEAASADPASKVFFRFREPPVGRKNKFEAALFRYWLLRDHERPIVRRVAIREFRWLIEKNVPAKSVGRDKEGTKKMPFWPEAKYAFQFFGKHCLGIAGRGEDASSPFRELDVAAFQAAVEDVFKYKIRTDVRKARVRKLLNVVQAYENNGNDFAAEDSPTGKALSVRGMAGDLRWNGDDKSTKGIVQLLKGISREKEIGSYSLREGRIGGWAEVRKALLAVHRKAPRANGKISDETALVTALTEGVDKEMEANRQGFGSADFFHELCDPDFFHLWLGGTEGEMKHGVKDFIPHYVSYCEWREELVGLFIKEDGAELEREAELTADEMEKLAKKPIRYTWPGLLNRHKKPSYRYYDFTGELNAAFQFKNLFRRVRAKDTDGKETRVERYEKLTGDKAKVTLACRRLKRDKIINKDTGNSVDALWCPPLILAGEANPTKGNRPRAGKYEDAKKKEWPKGDAETSFSLIAQPKPGDYWNELSGVPGHGDGEHTPEPIHLTVSFKIEANALVQLQDEGVRFVGGSLKGVDEEDEKRKFFRWPMDIDAEKVAAAEAEAKAKLKAAKEGKPAPKVTRKADVKPDKLWCAYAGGFQVKKSRYSKADETKRVPDIHVLSIDLGNRFAAAFTRLRIHADENGEGRVISADGFSPVIEAELVREGTLRLQGEGAKVWDHVRNEDGTCKKDANGNYLYALEDEIYGNGGRGRYPDPKLGEYQKFKDLAARLVPVTALSLDGTEKLTYPELGDHLIFRLKRRIGRLRTLFNLTWQLLAKHERKQNTGTLRKKRSEDDELFHKRVVVETLARSKFPKHPRQPGEEEEPGDTSLRNALASDGEWQRIKESNLLDSVKGAAEKKRRTDLETALRNSAAWKWDALAEAVKNQIRNFMEGPDSLDCLLVAVVEFCLPLKGRHWRWRHNVNGERLSWDKRDSSPEWNPNVMGMRGLSMRRLEQILNLRQRCQSYAKLEDRYHGPYKAGNYNPPDSTRDERPDVCPLLLERSNRIREQRVDQTAHLILTEALGMELKNPAEVEKKKERKNEVDLHGEYQRRKDKHGKPYPRCSVIVLENLDRYKMSLGRTKSENSRLMKWAHGKILDKLEDMCRPFGITLMLVDPAFSSHFDARTGLPGVRVNQVSAGFDKEYPYNRWIEGKTKSGGETQIAKDIKALADIFEKNKDYQGTLVLAVEGGKEFVPVQPPPGASDDREGIINADVCAAGNIGLRGVADPQRWDIFPRLRTKQVSETEVSVTNWRGWFGKFANNSGDRLMKWSDKSEVGAEGAIAPGNASGKRKSAKGANAPSEGSTSVEAESQSSQSSEYPPFFVEHPKHDWLPNGDWLKKAAFSFKQADKTVRAFRQGEYLKRVEQVCSERIRQINRARIERRTDQEDEVPME